MRVIDLIARLELLDPFLPVAVEKDETAYLDSCEPHIVFADPARMTEVGFTYYNTPTTRYYEGEGRWREVVLTPLVLL